MEQFNRTLTEHLFGHQYAVEMHLPLGQWSTAWLKRLPMSLPLLTEKSLVLSVKNLLLQSKKNLSPLNPLQSIPDLFA